MAVLPGIAVEVSTLQRNCLHQHGVFSSESTQSSDCTSLVSCKHANHKSLTSIDGHIKYSISNEFIKCFTMTAEHITEKYCLLLIASISRIDPPLFIPALPWSRPNLTSFRLIQSYKRSISDFSLPITNTSDPPFFNRVVGISSIRL